MMEVPGKNGRKPSVLKTARARPFAQLFDQPVDSFRLAHRPFG